MSTPNASPEDIAVARVLKSQMGLRDLKQKDIVEATGITKSQLSRKLKGERPLELDDIVKISRAIGVDAQDVISVALNSVDTLTDSIQIINDKNDEDE